MMPFAIQVAHFQLVTLAQFKLVTYISELLSERDGIDISRTTLRRILVNAGLSSPRRRK